jgi:hypothetical protein
MKLEEKEVMSLCKSQSQEAQLLSRFQITRKSGQEL